MFKLYWQHFIRPYWAAVITAIVCFLVASMASLAAPIIIKLLIDTALTLGNMTNLHKIIAAIVGLYLLRGLFFYFYNFTMAQASNKMIARMRQDLFGRLQGRDYAYFVSQPSGNIISVFTNDLMLLQQSLSIAIPDLVVESINVIATMAIMIWFDWQLAFITFATLPLIILAINFFNRRIAKLGLQAEETLSEVTSIVQQSVLSIMLVQSYVREEYEYNKFRYHNTYAAEHMLRVQRLHAIFVPFIEFLAAIGLTMIIWFGGREVIQGELTIGGMFAFLVYIINVPTPVRKISEALGKMKLGTIAWQRIQQIESSYQDLPNGMICLDKLKGHVKFEQVSFSYLPEQGTLKNITLEAKPGDVIAIVGPSGAGKSSFANLLLRFYDPNAGVIRLDGIDIKEMAIHSVRRQIGFIQQDPILFNTTILDNIKYGKPAASMEEVIAAAKIADAHDFIMELPQGYYSLVGELGGFLSGGQKQRIAIARAMLLDPPIFLLDEPTAALDAQAEKQVMAAVRKAGFGRTTFIITHRLSTLIASDKIVYLKQGQIAEMGTHEELMKSNGLYAKALQFGDLQV